MYDCQQTKFMNSTLISIVHVSQFTAFKYGERECMCVRERRWWDECWYIFSQPSLLPHK